MTKAELVSQVTERTHLMQRAAKLIVDTISDGMEKSLTRGGRIEVRG